MNKSPHRYQLGKAFAIMAIAISVFGISGSTFAATFSAGDDKNTGNDLSTADWNKVTQALTGVYFDETRNETAWGFGTNYVAGTTITTATGISVGTGGLDLAAGTATAGQAPIKFTSGINLTTPEAGAMEFDGTNLYFTAVDTRKTIALAEDLTSSPFAITTGVISNENGTYASNDFVFGASQLDNDANTDHYSRLFFDKSKGAFRAGYVDGTTWDDASRGISSVAIGYNTIASGSTSFAVGYATQATGYSAVALGQATIASGNYTTAIGHTTTAHDILETVLGTYNIVGTGNQTGWVSTDNLFVIGNGIDNTNRSNALTILKNGSMAIGNTGIINGVTMETGPDGTVPLAVATTGYVDDAIISGAVTASNGLTKTGGDIALGGTYINDIEIITSTLNSKLNLVNGSNAGSDAAYGAIYSELFDDPAGNEGFGVTYSTQALLSSQNSTLKDSLNQTGTDFLGDGAYILATDGSYGASAIMEAGTNTIFSNVSVTEGGATLRHIDGGSMQIQLTSSGMNVLDSINSIGLIYTADYSTNFTDRSLVDKEYVDNAVGGSQLTKTTGTPAKPADTGGACIADADVGKLVYYEDTDNNNLGSFWGCAHTGTGTADTDYTFVAISIFSE